MSTPVIGAIQQFYCDCLEKKKTESLRDRDFRTEERTSTEQGPLSVGWICKARKQKSWTESTGLFSSREVGAYMYYWECVNCGKKREIGIWDSDGRSYGDSC